MSWQRFPKLLKFRKPLLSYVTALLRAPKFYPEPWLDAFIGIIAVADGLKGRFAIGELVNQ